MKKQTVSSLLALRQSQQAITWLTCYDYSFASVLNRTDVDLILVGDSGGMVLLGYSDTVPVSMDEMLFMCKAVRRGAPNKFIVGDMPKGSYEFSDEDAARNAMRFIKEAGCDAVKLEGGMAVASRIKAIRRAGIPVIGHIGLTPQTSSQFGGYRVVGKKEEELEILLSDSSALQESGVFGILLEALPEKAAMRVTQSVNVITFGIGAGPKVNGQLLILHDLLGLYPNFRPKFAKCYVPVVLPQFLEYLESFEDLIQLGRANREDGFAKIAELAINWFIKEVRNGNFPSEEYSY